MAPKVSVPCIRQKLDFTEEISVIVRECRLTVHKSVLVRDSDYFRAACKEEWISENRREVKLPDPDTTFDTFSHYVQWLYSRQVVVMDEDDGLLPDTTDAVSIIRKYRDLWDLWILGDQLGDLPLRNAVVNELLFTDKKHNAITILLAVKPFWDKVPAASTMRKVILDCCASRKIHERLKTLIPILPQSLCNDILLHIVAVNEGLDQKRALHLQDRCLYHEHNERYPKCLKP